MDQNFSDHFFDNVSDIGNDTQLDQREVFYAISKEFIFTIIFLIVATVGNILSILVMRRKAFRNTSDGYFSQYLQSVISHLHGLVEIFVRYFCISFPLIFVKALQLF